MRTTTFTLALAAFVLPVAAGAQQWRTIESARQLTSTDETKVRLTFAGGKFELDPLPGALLYQMQLRYDEQNSDAVHEYKAAGRELALGLAQTDMGWRAMRAMKKNEGGSMRVGLNPRVPFDLDLSLGGADADVELGGMLVKRLDVHTAFTGNRVNFSTPNLIEMDELTLDVGMGGVAVENLGNANVSQINIHGAMDGVMLDFGDHLMRDVKINADVAFGGLKIQLPSSVGVTVQADTKLASFKPQGFTKMNGAWFTPNWNQSSTHVTIVANAAFGGLEVNHAEP